MCRIGGGAVYYGNFDALIYTTKEAKGIYQLNVSFENEAGVVLENKIVVGVKPDGYLGEAAAIKNYFVVGYRVEQALNAESNGAFAVRHSTVAELPYDEINSGVTELTYIYREADTSVEVPYADGEYQGSGRGYNNKITILEVTVEEEIITGVEIVSYGDTEGYFKQAVDIVIPKIIEK